MWFHFARPILTNSVRILFPFPFILEKDTLSATAQQFLSLNHNVFSCLYAVFILSNLAPQMSHSIILFLPLQLLWSSV